ncbi:MAG: protein-S-isoprenylcysteine O-methyltransferase Ste14 [Marinoscillum sp.]|jgi:protein-S-isoprenylcysteine O-methyltransferase Ste14
MDYKESKAPLTKEDIKTLRKNIIGGAVFGVFAIIVFGAMFSMIVSIGDSVTFYIFGGFGLFFFGIIAYIIGGPLLDIKSGQKTIITGKITNKERFQNASSGKKSKSQPKYYFYFGEQKYVVSDEHFHLANVGDEIALHYGRRSHTSLAVERLSTGGTTSEANHQEPTPTSPRDFMEKLQKERASVKKNEFPLDADDLKRLRATRNKKVGSNIFLLFFFSLFALAFSLGLFLFHWLFIIPEVIFFIIIGYALKWITQCFRKYQKDRDSGMKTAALSRVKDKLMHGGSRKGFSITTTYGSFPISKEEYDKINTGDQVFTFHGKHSNWLIGLKVQ